MREGWKSVKLGDVIELKRGYNLPSQSRIIGEYPIISSNGVNGHHNEFKVKGEGVITGRYGTIGEVFFVTENFWPLNTSLYVRDFKGNDKRYIYYLLQTIDLKSFNAAGAVPGINRNHIHSLNISIPPLETQKKIASILSGYDDLIENNLKRIKILEEMVQQTYEEWFVRMRFPGYETAEMNEETGLPVGWQVELVGKQLAKVKSTLKIKSSDIQKEGAIPVIDQSRDFIAGFTDEPSSIMKYENTPFLVFGDHTRILKLVNFDFARGADGTQIIVSNNERIPQHLFYLTLKNIDLSNYHYARHFKYLKDSEIIVPTKEIAHIFEVKASEIYATIRNLQNQNQRLREGRDILLPRLMMGMVEV